MADQDVKEPIIPVVPPTGETKVENNKPDGEQSTPPTDEEIAAEETAKQEARAKKQGRLNNRFKELTQKVHEREADAAGWRETLQEVTGEAPPVRSEYTTHEEYMEAVVEYREKIRTPKAMLDKAEKDVVKADQELTDELIKSWDSKVEDAVEDLPDYNEVVGKAKIPISPMVLRAILKRDNGPHIVYHLASNPDEMHDINALPEDEQLLEIGRIASSLKTASKAPAVDTKPKPKVPNPPTGSKTKSESAPLAKKPGDMSLEEFAEWRKTHG